MGRKRSSRWIGMEVGWSLVGKEREWSFGKSPAGRTKRKSSSSRIEMSKKLFYSINSSNVLLINCFIVFNLTTKQAL